MITHAAAFYLLMRPQPKVAVAGNATASWIGLDTQHGFHAHRGIREDRKIRPLLTSHSIPTATRRWSRKGSSWPISDEPLDVANVWNRSGSSQRRARFIEF
jgi:hypothetical protein